MIATQIQIEFKTESPINIEKFNRQNKDVFIHLMSGRRINLESARILYGIRNLHSRIPEIDSALIDLLGIKISRERVKIKDVSGYETQANDYWLPQIDIDRINNYRKQKQAA